MGGRIKTQLNTNLNSGQESPTRADVSLRAVRRGTRLSLLLSNFPAHFDPSFRGCPANQFLEYLPEPTQSKPPLLPVYTSCISERHRLALRLLVRCPFFDCDFPEARLDCPAGSLYPVTKSDTQQLCTHGTFIQFQVHTVSLPDSSLNEFPDLLCSRDEWHEP